MNLQDLSSPEFYRDPYPLYEKIRARGKLFNVAPHILMTGHYDMIDAILVDRRMGKGYMESVRARYGEDGAAQPVFQGLARMFLMMNPPAHTRLRALLMKAFDARRVDSLRQVCQEVADELIDAFPKGQAFDLVPAYSQPLPVRIICRLLDIPVEDADMLERDVSQLVQALEAAPLPAAALEKVNAAMATVEDYFRRTVRARRERPGDDLISVLLSVQEDGQGLTEDELVSNVILLFVAGHETTANMIGNALISLHKHPDQLRMLEQQPELLPRAINECMRYDSSVQFITRMALEDTEAGGIALPKGSLVFMSLGAANRDPERFADPDRLLIERAESGNRLIAFGGGIHYCLGARLAAMELQIGLGTLLARLPGMRVVDLDALQWRKRNTVRGVEALVVAS
jgi:cytochrome P450